MIAGLGESLECKSRTDNPFFEYASKPVMESDISSDENNIGNSASLCPKIFRRFKLLLFAGCNEGSSMNYFRWLLFTCQLELRLNMKSATESINKEVNIRSFWLLR